MVDIESLKFPGAQRGAGVQAPEVKVKVIELRVGSPYETSEEPCHVRAREESVSR
jgi:hypothetical protein